MKIESFKKMSKNKYKLIFSDQSFLTVYEDVIVKNNLLTNKDIDLEKIKKENNEIDIYYQALSCLNKKMRSTFELKKYLNKKDYNSKLITDTINKLTQEGYLNDLKYAQAFVNDRVNLSNDGPDKIKKDLESHQIDLKIIEEIISQIKPQDLEEKINRIISKNLKLNKKYNGQVLKMKILNKFINLGYNMDQVISLLENYNLNDQLDIQKDYDKLLKKYQSKYDDYKLKMTIKQKLYQKGYNSQDIEKIERN